MNRTWLRIRQWAFPAEFRIRVEGGGDWWSAMAGLVSEALAEAKSAQAAQVAEAARAGEAVKTAEALRAAEAARAAAKPAEAPPAAPPPAKAPAGITERFAISLCNDVFRLRRNAEVLAGKRGDCKELRSIASAMTNVDALLAENGIKYYDLTGKDFDERSEDFDPVGQPEEVPGLDRKIICVCERPLVLLNGKLIQRARGIVQKPAPNKG